MRTNEWPEKDRVIFGAYLHRHSYLSEKNRLYYVATPKVACTTIKWWFASMEGYSEDVKKISDSMETDLDLIIHDSYKVAQHVTGLDFNAISKAIDSDFYFKFCVVRNPYKRIFSAWQSKLLLREPLQISPYLNCDFFNHVIQAPGDISRAFERFLEYLFFNEAPAFQDFHWTPQYSLLRTDLLNYSGVFKLEDTKEIEIALSDWLGEGVPSPFCGRRANESLIPYDPSLITTRSAELINSLYCEDFESFGYDRSPPAGTGYFNSDHLGIAIRAIQMIRGKLQRLGQRNLQIEELNQIVNQRNADLEILRRTLAECEAQSAAQEARIGELLQSS